MTREIHTIAGHGLTASFLDLGATLHALRLEGHETPLNLGLADTGDYPGKASYMGATAGRVINRIGGASFTLDGTTHRTDPNFLGKHTLHGGSAGMGRRDWTVADRGADWIAFRLVQEVGDMGFPGRLEAEARFALEAGATLRIDYRATADSPTPCMMGHHSYWKLDDADAVDDHVLTLAADRMTVVDEELIPTGEVASVAGTPFDFRAGRPVGGFDLLDHNLCTADARGALREVGSLRSPRSGVAMRIATTEPGMQVYDGAKLKPAAGIGGLRYGPRAGVALEPQNWPDAVNHDGFPDCVLRPGERYHQTTTFSFSKG